MPKNYVAKEALRQDCGAGVPPAFVRSHVLGRRDGRTTILPKFSEEPFSVDHYVRRGGAQHTIRRERRATRSPSMILHPLGSEWNR